MASLRPDRKLINNDFEGYKLNSNGLETFTKSLVTNITHMKQDANKFTYNYIRQQLMQNNLFYNQWTDLVYFVDENLNITAIELEKVISC